MDDRTLRILVRLSNETKLGFAEIQAQLAALKGEEGFKGVDKAAQGLGDRIFGIIPPFRLLGRTMAGEVAAGFGIALASLLPFVVALGALVANWLSMAALFTVGTGGILALLGGILLLGGGTPGSANALTSANKQVATAAEAHENAVRKLTEGYVAWNSTATHTQLMLMRLQDLQERVRDTQQKLTEAQTKAGDAQKDVSPAFLKVQEDFGSMIDSLREQARPLANQILGWIDSLIPQIGAAGTKLLEWVGPRLPGFLTYLGQLWDELVKGVQKFGSTMGDVINYVVGHKTEFSKFFGETLGQINGFIEGAMNLFKNIHNWFKDNWPKITGWIGDFTSGISAWGPILGPEIDLIKKQLGDIGAHLKELQPLWILMGLAAGIALGGILLVAIALLAALRGIEKVLQAVQALGRAGLPQITIQNGRPQLNRDRGWLPPLPWVW